MTSRLRTFIDSFMSKGNQDEASKPYTFTSGMGWSGGMPNKNGDMWGHNLADAYTQYQQTDFYKQHTYTENQSLFSFSQDTADYVAEVFVDEIGKILEPFTEGVAFNLCKMDRWFDPECRPGIVSFIYPKPTYRQDKAMCIKTSSQMLVLYAEDQYIELHPDARLITDERTLNICKAHFEQRGFDFLDETRTTIPVFDFDFLDGPHVNDWGQREEEARNRSYISDGRSTGDVKISPWRFPSVTPTIPDNPYGGFVESVWCYEKTTTVKSQIRSSGKSSS